MLSKEYLFSKEILSDYFYSILNEKSYTINYVKVCNKYNKDNNIIIREVGDGGDQEFTWQLFVSKENLELVLKTIEKILNDT